MAVEERAWGTWARRRRVWAAVLWMAVPLLASQRSEGSTPAGTVVVNVAAASWDGGETASEPASFAVGQVAAVAAEPSTGAAAARAGEPLSYPVSITNTGNGPDQFTLDVFGEQGWPVAVYRDDNGDGIHQESETSVLSITDPLAPGERAACVLVVQAQAVRAASERTWLRATSVADPQVWAEGSYTSALLTGPVAEFVVTPASGTVPLQVSFQDQSSGAPTAWAWDFGDGGTSAEQNPQHTYNAAGSYTVFLTASNADGADTAAKSDCVVVTGADGADFLALPTNGSAPLRVEFRDTSRGNISAWNWSFGDGDTSTRQNPSHRYSRVGNFTVSLTITTPTGDVTTTKPDCVVVDYRDVAKGHWAYQPIMAASSADLATGYPDGTYHPQQVVTRDQIATFLARALAGGDAAVPAGPAQASFGDVPSGHWAYRYVEYLAARQVARGYAGGGYEPAREVDRAQVAAFVARSVALAQGGASPDDYTPPGMPTFADVPSRHWAYRFIEYSAARGIVTGYPDGSYQPDAACTRDQIAVFLTRAFVLTP